MTENRSNYTKNYFLFQMGRLKVCTIFSVIFATLGFPLINLLFSIEESEIDFDTEILLPLLLLGIICILGTCAMSYITPILAYRHLYTKTNADNILSLPLTANQRFFADTAATYTSFALPYLISCGIAALLSLGCHPISSTHQLAQYALQGFFLLVSFSALNIGVITCCGRIVEAILYPIAINSVMPLICAFAIQMSYMNCVGIDVYSDDLFRNAAVRIWPFGNALSILFSGEGNIYFYALIMTVIFLAAAYFGYTKRHAENIGKSFVFRYSYLVASSLVAITLVFAYTFAMDMEPAKGNMGVVLPLAIILFILMLIMEIINYKKIMSVIKFLLRYVAILGGGIFACFLFSKSGGFGAENFIPTASSIESVSVQYHDFSANGSNSRNSITVKSEEMINLVRDEHKAVLEKAKQNEEAYEQHVYISYNLKTGGSVSREYHLPASVNAHSDNFWMTLFNSADYSVDELDDIITNDYMNRLDNAVVQLKNYHSSKIYIEYKTSDIDTLIKALEKDLLADETFGRHDEAPIGILSIGYNESDIDEIQAYAVTTSYVTNFHSAADITIYDSYENTLALIKQHGTIPTPEAALNDSVKNCEVFMLYRTLKTDSNHPSTEIYNREQASAIFITAEEFKELAAHHVKYNLPAKSDTEYNYHVVRGLWSDLEQYNHSNLEYIVGLIEIGMDYGDYSEYEFLDDYSLYYKDNYYETDLHESMNEYCDELFKGRTKYDLTY